jgi:hypothetical protein
MLLIFLSQSSKGELSGNIALDLSFSPRLGMYVKIGSQILAIFSFVTD